MGEVKEAADKLGLTFGWRMFIEHKMFEPSFYSTVIQDWGSNLLAAQHLGDKCFSLVDLGHHAPNVNIEMIVARLIQFEKLAGFHFNDSNLKLAYQTDVTPILSMARFKAGGAIDPIGFYRSLNYRESLESKRPASANPSSGIV